MILLDTNVISAAMAPHPPQSILDWLNAQGTEALFLSAVTVAEITYGIRSLPDGKRRQQLEERFEAFLVEGFEHRILPFDARSALQYGDVMVHRRKIGRPLGTLDGQIASIARTHRMAVATHNVRDFEECGLELINPFELGA